MFGWKSFEKGILGKVVSRLGGHVAGLAAVWSVGGWLGPCWRGSKKCCLAGLIMREVLHA